LSASLTALQTLAPLLLPLAMIHFVGSISVPSLSFITAIVVAVLMPHFASQSSAHKLDTQ
jgi:hypothetical protein